MLLNESSSQLVFEILIILALLIVNGLLAMCEIALVSSRRTKLEQLAEKGNNGAMIALDLLKKPERFFSAIQVGITAIGIVAGVYGGEAFAIKLQYFLESVGIKSYTEEMAFALIVFVITYFSIIIGELAPKTIALNNPEIITIKLAPFMKALSVLLFPVVSFLSWSTRIVLKLLLIKEKKRPPITEEDLKYMIDTGSRHGIIEKAEGEIMQSVFRFGDKKAVDIMTRKTQINWIDIHQGKEDIRKLVLNSTNTKFPVCDKSLDKIIGAISLSDTLKFISDKEEEDMKKYLFEALTFTQETPSLAILDAFRKKGIHIGFVLDNNKHLLGLITLHDLVENIMGELPEIEIYEAQVIQRPDGSLLADGVVSLTEINKQLGYDGLLNTESYKSIAELIADKISEPKTGASFTYGGYRFEIVDMDGKKIDKVLITSLSSNLKE